MNTEHTLGSNSDDSIAVQIKNNKTETNIQTSQATTQGIIFNDNPHELFRFK